MSAAGKAAKGVEKIGEFLYDLSNAQKTQVSMVMRRCTDERTV